MIDERGRRVHVWVSGMVQGVYYRASTRDRAQSLGLGGWVRNLPDGRVELVVEGPAVAVSALLDFCRRGPRGAQVDRLEESEELPTGEFAGFQVRH